MRHGTSPLGAYFLVGNSSGTQVDQSDSEGGYEKEPGDHVTPDTAGG
jgi:hypothetical protein